MKEKIKQIKLNYNNYLYWELSCVGKLAKTKILGILAKS